MRLCGRPTARGFSSKAGQASLQGRLWARGIGINGALGQGSDVAAKEEPVRVSAGDLGDTIDVASAASGWAHSAVVSRDGSAFVFGRTHDVEMAVRLGRLAHIKSRWLPLARFAGTGSAIDAPEPRLLTAFRARKESYGLEGFVAGEKIAQVACGAGLTALVSDQGALYLFGSNQYGQCAQDSRETYVWEPTTPIGLEDGDWTVTSVALGFRHGVACTARGNVYTWGKGNRGQLGHGIAEDGLVMRRVQGIDGEVVKVSAGVNSCLALTADGKVFAWGKFQSPYLSFEKKSEYRDAMRPFEVATGFDDGERVLDVWSGGHTHVALTDKRRLLQWGMLSDKSDSAEPTVQAQLAKVKPEGWFADIGPRSAAARTVTEPVPVALPPAVLGEASSPGGSASSASSASSAASAPSAGLGRGDLQVRFARDSVLLLAPGATVAWDWNMRPVPLPLFDDGVLGLLEGEALRDVLPGWQHTLYLTCSKDNLQ